MERGNKKIEIKNKKNSTNNSKKRRSKNGYNKKLVKQFCAI